ncbi:MAG: hypothetical protein OJF49_000042 [Ktedonobacterales bacterium]|nr:MAG: hypothetical protein OJF49_000042 [Ktedonobacterales bacterium]
MIQASDTPTSQPAATRWTFYRRFGLLLRTCLDEEGATLSLNDVAARTHNRVSPDQLQQLLAQDARIPVDPVIYVLLAQAFDVDPDFFVSDVAVAEYIDSIHKRFVGLNMGNHDVTLQAQAVALRESQRLAPGITVR